jgi:hypothetical protein
MNVYLSDESYITPVNTQDDGTNIHGKFSRDYIAGAMRVAIIDDTGLKMLWAPNSSYQLIQNNNGSYALKTGEYGDSVPESDYYYFAENEDGELVQQKVSPEAYASKQFVVDGTGAMKDEAGNSPTLATLIPASEGAYAQKTVKIRIWFEGTDREAHQALAGGNVNVKLKFVGVSKETDLDKQAQIDSITYDQEADRFTGMADGMVFTTDGRTWTEYKSSAPNMPVLESGSSIFIKYPETDTHFETNYIKFTKD